MNQQTYNQQPNPNLPPAGYQRQETLKQRTDNLQQQAEQRSEKEERFSIDPNKVEPIREIQYNMSALKITGKLPGYEYCWVNFKSPIDTPGLAIQQKQAITCYNHETKAYESVWEVVHGDMPEAVERKGVDSLRKLGDVLLMRAKKDAYAALMRYQAQQRGRLLQSDQARLMDLGEKANRAAGGGIIIHPEGHPAYMQSKNQMPAQGVPTLDTVNRQIKNGSLPGAEVENWAGKR